jgi:hypothetical protein
VRRGRQEQACTSVDQVNQRNLQLVFAAPAGAGDSVFRVEAYLVTSPVAPMAETRTVLSIKEPVGYGWNSLSRIGLFLCFHPIHPDGGQTSLSILILRKQTCLSW